MPSSLDRVAHWLVTDDNPPRELDGLDAERCVALHNAIFEHGWLKSGRSHEAWLAESRTWWENRGQEAENSAHRFHPSLRAFLKEARVLPCHLDQSNFFYHLNDLLAVDFWEEPDFDDDTFLTLYSTTSNFCSHAVGMGYDQQRHLAMMRWSITDGNPFTGGFDSPEGWYGEKLESVLTVYAEMIRRGKVVALPQNVSRGLQYIRMEGGEWRQTMVGPEKDPETGAVRMDRGFEPWTIVAWTPKDLEDCLNVWEMLVAAVERRLPLDAAGLDRLSITIFTANRAGVTDPATSQGLYDEATIDAAGVPKDGFLYHFLTRARKPRFTLIAPGLRVQTPAEFSAQPFVQNHRQHQTADEHADPGSTPPFLLFCHDDRTDPVPNQSTPPCYTSRNTQAPADWPVGLYIDRCSPHDDPFPFADGCRLKLPFTLGANAYAKQSDQYSPVHSDSLLQSGLNPFIERHSVQLQAVLENAYVHVERGQWTVDERGVTGGIEVWKDADTEERWASYWVPINAARYW